MEGMSGRGCTNNTSIEIQSIGVEAAPVPIRPGQWNDDVFSTIESN